MRFTDCFPLGDGIGRVGVLDTMGSDADIVSAARTSYGNSVSRRSKDRDLLRYLLRHRHTSPFEMCEIKLFIVLPIFVARQWIRHRTANVNEMSLRYSESALGFYVPPEDLLCGQSATNKQGSSEPLPPDLGAQVQAEIRTSLGASQAAYERLLRLGLARESARIVLPTSTYTKWVWKIDLHNLLHFLKLRLSPHAQPEIRRYAQAIADIVRTWVPVTWEAFCDYQLQSLALSRLEIEALRTGETSGMTSREVREFQEKRTALGVK